MSNEKMESKVYFTDFHCVTDEGPCDKLKRLIRAAGIEDIDMDGKFVAIKMHFGELGNMTFLRPNYAKAVVDTINGFSCGEMWQDASPIWCRPQYYKGRLYKPRKLLQVVGHTPVGGITRKGNLISCDVFSTDSVGKPIGTQEFMVIDTVAWDYQSIR